MTLKPRTGYEDVPYFMLEILVADNPHGKAGVELERRKNCRSQK